jgi:NAD(P)H-hydrate epimerase
MNPTSIEGLRIPALTAEQMREVDRLMSEKYDIKLIQMMENTGVSLVKIARVLMCGSAESRSVIVAAGLDNNGRGGLVAARHLSNWGAAVAVLLPERNLKEVPRIQINIIEKLLIIIKTGNDALRYFQNWYGDIVLDSLVGYGLPGNPRGWIKELIGVINSTNIPIVSLDVPSGLDTTTGDIFDPCVRASATVTLALLKRGFLKTAARNVAGDIYLADIDMPLLFMEKWA